MRYIVLLSAALALQACATAPADPARLACLEGVTTSALPYPQSRDPRFDLASAPLSHDPIGNTNLRRVEDTARRQSVAFDRCMAARAG